MSLLRVLEQFCYKPHTISQGTVLLKEGQATDTTYVLIDGSFKVTAGDVDIGSFKHAGDTFGEMACILEEEVSATVTAECECRVYLIKDVKSFLLKNPQQAVDLLNQSYNRLKQMNRGVNFMLKMIP